MGKLWKVLVLCLVLFGCNSPDHLAGKALNQFAKEKYGDIPNLTVVSTKVIKAVQTKTDLNTRYYACLGVIKLKGVATGTVYYPKDTFYKGDTFWVNVYTKLRFAQGQTGVIETGGYDRQDVVSRDGAEVPVENLEAGWVNSLKSDGL